MSTDRSTVGLFVYGEGPAKQETKEAKNGFVDRHFGAILALVGVVVTAAFAAFSNLFGATGANSAPTATLVYAERYQSIGGAEGTAQVPVDTTLRFFAGDSSDPNSELSSLQHTWIVTPGDALDACNAAKSSCRHFDFTPETPGDYMISLVVSDAENLRNNCPLIHLWNNRLGCASDAVATVQVEVIPARDPEIVLSGGVSNVVRGETITLNAALSTSFDDSLPSLNWLLDGELHARGRSQFTIETSTIPEDVAEFAVTVNATDRLGHTSSLSLSTQIIEPNQVALPEVVAASDQRPEQPNEGPPHRTLSFILVCRGGSEVSLNAPISVNVPNQPCVLPSRIVTNGNPIDIISNTIMSANSEIVAFRSGAANGLPGTQGTNGRSGAGLGQDGEPGQRGADGTAGDPGAAASPISMRAETFLGNLRIDNAGQPGGVGGAGGTGGDGGAGAPGAPSQPGIFDCRRGPGRGGNGGTGGDGGDGGNAGAGGEGGPIFLQIGELEAGATIELVTVSGLPGEAGLGGPPGRGGRAGPEGATGGPCGSAGRSGQPGQSGRTGSTGDLPTRLAPAPVTINSVVQDRSLQSQGAFRVVSSDL